MTYALAVDLARQTVITGLMLAGPLLVAALVVGLTVSVLQAVTQVQEQTVAFVARLFAVGTVFLLILPWTLQVAVQHATELFRSLPSLSP